MFERFALLILASFFLASCAAIVPKIDPTAYPIDQGPKESPPKVCKSAYEAIFPKVGGKTTLRQAVKIEKQGWFKIHPCFISYFPSMPSMKAITF